MVDAGFEPTTQKTHDLSTTPFVKVIIGALVRLTTCKRLSKSLPKLSLTTGRPVWSLRQVLLQAGRGIFHGRWAVHYC